jgi:hypothetical protein
MPKEQSTFSSLLKIIFIIIGAVLLVHSFFRLLTDLNSYNFNNILTEIFIGFIFIFSPFFRNALLIVSIWVLVSMGVVTTIANYFGSIGAFLSLVFCVVFPFWAFGKYEDCTSNKADSSKDANKVSDSSNKSTQTIGSFADEAVIKENSVIKNHIQLQPKPIQNFLKPLQKDYHFAGLNWYRDNAGIHCDALQEFYPNNDFTDDGIDVEIRYRGTSYHIPITKIENYTDLKNQSNLF